MTEDTSTSKRVTKHPSTKQVICRKYSAQTGRITRLIVGRSRTKRLLESELTGKMYKNSAKYIPLQPLEEAPDSSWCEAAQKRLFESELAGKGYQQIPKCIEIEPKNETTLSTRERSSDLSLGEQPAFPTTSVSFHSTSIKGSSISSK